MKDHGKKKQIESKIQEEFNHMFSPMIEFSKEIILNQIEDRRVKTINIVMTSDLVSLSEKIEHDRDLLEKMEKLINGEQVCYNWEKAEFKIKDSNPDRLKEDQDLIDNVKNFKAKTTLSPRSYKKLKQDRELTNIYKE